MEKGIKVDKEFENLKKRVEKYGITITEPSVHTRNISKKTDFTVFNNRQKHQSVIIHVKKLKKLLNAEVL